MAEFFDHHYKNLGENWIKGQMGTNESKPANEAAGKKQSVAKSFTAINSDGPWVCDAAKSGNPGATDAWGKINKTDKETDYRVDAGK